MCMFGSPCSFADAAIERLVLGMRMDVDEAGDHRPANAVDDPVRNAGVSTPESLSISESTILERLLIAGR